MRVAVIGCGPAALAAAHAAHGLKADVTIFGPMVKSPQLGPLVLQRPIPGINNDHPDGYIRQLVIGGSILDYRYKLYGDININIQGDILRDGYHVWNFISTYETLWRRYIEDSLVTGVRLDKTLVPGHQLQSMQYEYNLVVNTAPLTAMCRRPENHHFISQRVSVIQETSYPDQPDDTIIFNAGADPEWVRSSRVLGNESTEWRIGNAPNGARIIHKPIRTNCDCFPRVLLTGRFGAWRNETWVDTAYYDTRDAIVTMSRKATWDNVT